MLISRGLARVISDLAALGYDAHWARFSASNFGAPHERDRLWLVANANGERLQIQNLTCRFSPKITGTGSYGSNMADANSLGCNEVEQSVIGGTPSKGLASQAEYSSFPAGREWWSAEPGLGRVADGVAHRVDRLKAIGNGQVPIVAKSAFEYLRNDK